MKNIIVILLGFMIFGILSCTKDFTDLNLNPNNPPVAPTTNTLGYSMQSLASRCGQTELLYPAAFVGYIAKGTYTTVNRYGELVPNSHWNNMYAYVIKNLNNTIVQAQNEELFNTEAAARVLKAYAFQMLVDAYGPVPYSECGKMAAGIVNPKYDNEKDIYLDLIESLKTANTLFNTTKRDTLGKGDLIYNGDLTKWKKFCNSLRLRLAIRISKIEPTIASTNIAEIFGNPTLYPVISSNADNATLKFPGGYFNEPWFSEYNTVNDPRMAKPIIDALKNLNDPRLAVYATKSGATFNGLETGNSSDNTIALINTTFRSATGSVYFLRYSEVEFIRAEAAMLNIIPAAGAQTAYENAVKASLGEYTAILATDITTYIAQPTVAWVSGDFNRLYTQKWLALFRQGWEAWAEMRRTDVPTILPPTTSAYPGHNRTPFRLHYPTDEKSLNLANMPSKVNEVDLYWGYKVWWDTRTGVN